MVRGPRVKVMKAGDASSYTEAKRKNCKMENMGNLANGVDATGFETAKLFSPPLTRSRNTAAQRSKVNSNVPLKSCKNGHITNYFQVVSPTNGFKMEDDEKPSKECIEQNGALNEFNAQLFQNSSAYEKQMSDDVKMEPVARSPEGSHRLISLTNGGSASKLTDYFPVRRSVRKTKKEVMEKKRRDLERAIREQREDGLEVTVFAGKGRGVVASRMFRRGDFVVEYMGELVSLAEARERELRYAQDAQAGCYMYYFRHNNRQYCIDATAETGKLGRLVNHSRNGNLITKSIFLGSIPRLVLLANQDISPGEEVTYDYGDRSKESLQHHPWLAL